MKKKIIIASIGLVVAAALVFGILSVVKHERIQTARINILDDFLTKNFPELVDKYVQNSLSANQNKK